MGRGIGVSRQKEQHMQRCDGCGWVEGGEREIEREIASPFFHIGVGGACGWD